MNSLREEILAIGPWAFGAGVYLAWCVLYLAGSTALYAVFHQSPENRVPRKQILWEIRHSFQSLAYSGLTGAVIMFCDARQWVHIDWSSRGWGRLVLELVGMMIWNEVHFTLCHRALHTRSLYRRVHWVHHRSRTSSPFAAFSFHGVEAALLNTVLVLPLAVYELSAATLFVFPLLSFASNLIGHSALEAGRARWMPAFIREASRRHRIHHERVHLHLGFWTG